MLKNVAKDQPRSKKLTLCKETVRELTTEEIGQVAGGSFSYGRTCSQEALTTDFSRGPKC